MKEELLEHLAGLKKVSEAYKIDSDNEIHEQSKSYLDGLSAGICLAIDSIRKEVVDDEM